MELLSAGLQEKSPFSHLEKFETLEFSSKQFSKTLHFTGVRAGEIEDLYYVTVIRKEDGLLWKSCQEVLDQSFKLASQEVKGFFGYELITFDMREGLTHFNMENFKALISKNAKAMEPGEKRVIRYTHFYGILQKRINEDWGKIDTQYFVESYLKSDEKLDLYLKAKFSELGEIASGRKTTLLIHDLSAKPIFQFGASQQTERLRSQLEKLKKKYPQNFPEILMVHRGSVIELGLQFDMRN